MRWKRFNRVRLLMSVNLPTKLLKGPLVDVTFEIRFDTSLPLSSILPGHLFSALSGTSIERLPHAEIPQQIRNNEPALQFMPLVRINTENYVIGVSDKSLQVSCVLPYLGWGEFKSKILEVLGVVKQLSVVGNVTRYSLKYTDILSSEFMNNSSDYLSATFSIGNHKLDISTCVLQAQIIEGDAINLLQIRGNVEIKVIETNESKTGILVDIDSIRQLSNTSLPDFVEKDSQELDSLHFINKKMFFDCLSAEGLKTLEPVYD